MPQRRSSSPPRRPQYRDLGGLRPRGNCGYADLLLAQANGGPDAMDVVAEMLGYRRQGLRRIRGEAGDEQPEVDQPTAEAEPPEFTTRPPSGTLFWRLEQRRFLAPAAPVETVAGLPTWQELPPRPAHATPLARWNALVQPLRTACSELVEGRAPDILATLRLLSKGQLLHRLPRQRRRRWGNRVQIIIDRSQRLTPFFAEQDATQDGLEARIRRLFAKYAVERAVYEEASGKLWAIDLRGRPSPYRPPEAGSLVIVLGDLGCLEHEHGPVVARWVELGRQLARAGCRAAALTPCSRAYWLPVLMRTWTLIAWDRAGPTEPLTLDERLARAENLLRWASPAERLEPGLLRDIRLLRGEEADAATEADAWQHQALSCRWAEAATYTPDAAKRLRAEFAQPVVTAAERKVDDAELRVIAEPRINVVRQLRRWHGAGQVPWVWFSELRNLHPAIRNLLPEQLLTGDMAAADQAVKHLALTLANYPDGRRWYRFVYERALPHYRETSDPELKAALQRLYVTAYEPVRDWPTPPGDFDPGLPPPPPGAPVLRFDLRQVGRWIEASDGHTDTSAGSLLASLDSTAGTGIAVLGGAESGPVREDFWATGQPPPWAHDWGTDEHGPWVSFHVPAEGDLWVAQRMRWCPPGTFMMGAPADEAERFDDEGPVHPVRIAQGFWMFDTACTEALWTAVMNRPTGSRKSGKFPITGVSWNDAQAFIAALNAKLPGLALSLPSEAQWEYACRAGTATPYSFGETIDKRQANFGSEGTVLVGSLPPNGWGLHEMHGNVWEWCADTWHDTYKGAPTDGSAWIEADRGAADRVLRGGSWGRGARDVRAACRLALDPARRDGFGFRCARVQAAGGAEQVAAPADPASRPGAERGRPQGPTSDDTLLRGGETRPCPPPRIGTMRIRSDREALTFRGIGKPDWASGIGRDRFGLFAEITVPGTEVSQRLRWIPPGRFRMGSPDDEPGRSGAEGPVHLVTVAEGFWLFDTPCTQALWHAVMGKNPSRFRSPRRPVEQVSFRDVEDFLRTLNRRFRDNGQDLALRLPSEAQWEYACRAGTETATYAGPIAILGANNAPILHDIAWYGGNSGQGFDLENGYDSSGWPDKQYDHTRAGTHAVGLKAANPWGLHDMLGNVWEWCADTWHDSYKGAPTDGSAWIEADRGAAPRVLRGGSWGRGARGVRAAYRSADDPASRYVHFGFRCARVQADSGATARAEGREEPAQRAERGAATTSPQRGRARTRRRPTQDGQ